MWQSHFDAAEAQAAHAAPLRAASIAGRAGDAHFSDGRVDGSAYGRPFSMRRTIDDRRSCDRATQLELRARRTLALALLLGATTSLVARTGHAAATDDEPYEARTATALIVGGALALVPFAVGGAMVANTSDPTVRRASVYVSSAGFTLAPLVAHGVMNEWWRGSAFAAVPFACGVSLAVLMQQPGGDVLTDLGSKETRIPFWILASAAFAGGALGVIDAAMAPSRHGARAFYVVPSVDRTSVAVSLGGVF